MIIDERFEFRDIEFSEFEQASAIEQVCFPPNEAATPAIIKERVMKAPETFLVAVERESGKIAGFLNGLATNENVFRDEFFTDINLHNPSGKNLMILGLDVLPEYRGHGLATKMMEIYVERQNALGRRMLILTCLEDKIGMYEKMGFENCGVATSSWGGELWYEMRRRVI